MPCAPALPDAAAAAPVAPELAPAAPPAPPPPLLLLEPVVAEPADVPAGADTVAVVVAGCVFLVALPRLLVSTVSSSAVPAWGTGAAMTALCGRLVPRFDAMVTTQSVVELNKKDKWCCSGGQETMACVNKKGGHKGGQ